MGADLNDIQAFVRVVDEQGFSAAARRLHVPVSSLSRRVARLEEKLGARLLHRTTRRLHLTDAGRAFYGRVSQCLAELEDAEQELTLRNATPRGRVRMTAPVDMRPLLSVILDFLKLYPEVEIDLDLSNRHVDLLGEGYDLALRASAVIHPSLIAQRVSSSGMRLVASPGYLQRRGRPTCLDDLRKHDCVILGTSTQGAYWNLRVGEELTRVPVSGRFAANSLEAVRQAVLEDLGIGLLPERSILHELERKALEEVLPEHWPPSTGIFLVYPSRRLMGSALRALIDYLLSHLRSDALASSTWSPHPPEPARDATSERRLRSREDGKSSTRPVGSRARVSGTSSVAARGKR